MNRSLLSLVATVLRDPGAAVDAANDRDWLAWATPRLLGVVLVGAGVFGGVIGAWRGGIQVPYAAIKMPALLVIPLIVGLPAVRALFSTVDVEVPWHRLTAAGLVGAARTAILAAALGPVVWLAWSVIWDYHLATLVLAGSVVLVGLQGLVAVRHALPTGQRLHLGAIAAAVMVLGLVTAQTGWVLRPFIARPTAEVAFLRPVEADVVSSLAQTTRSAVGDYDDWQPESSGLAGRGLRRRGGE